MGKMGSELLHGTLELLVLHIVENDAMHGYAIGRRIEELTQDALSVEEGSLYPALYRMERRGWLKTSWRVTENNRRAKFYRVTAAGRRRLTKERAQWSHFQTAVQKILQSV